MEGKPARTFEQKMRYLEAHGSAEEIEFSVSWELLKWLRDALLLPAQTVNAKPATIVTTAAFSQDQAVKTNVA